MWRLSKIEIHLKWFGFFSSPPGARCREIPSNAGSAAPCLSPSVFRGTQGATSSLPLPQSLPGWGPACLPGSGRGFLPPRPFTTSPCFPRLLETSWTAAYQVPPSMGFSRQQYGSGVPFPKVELLNQRICFWNFDKYCQIALHWGCFDLYPHQ